MQKYNSVPHKFVEDIHVLSVNLCNKILIHVWPVPVAARSKAWVCGRSPAEIVSSNTTGGQDVFRECCVLSGRGLCDELIIRAEESYRLWCVVVCDLETS